MGILAKAMLVPTSSCSEGTVLIEARGASVIYPLGVRSDDIQSLVYRAITRREVRTQTVRALDGLDFVGTAGEIIGILGSNGAGKSTFCKLVSGILKPD